MPGMMIDAVAQCSYCRASKKLQVTAGSRLKVGDAVYEDPSNHNYARCTRCKRTMLVITQVETSISTSKPRGFWKIPKGRGGGGSE